MQTRQQSALMWGALVQQPPLAQFSILVIAWLAQVDDLCESVHSVCKLTFPSIVWYLCGSRIVFSSPGDSFHEHNASLWLHEEIKCWIFSHFIWLLSRVTTLSPLCRGKSLYCSEILILLLLIVAVVISFCHSLTCFVFCFAFGGFVTSLSTFLFSSS